MGRCVRLVETSGLLNRQRIKAFKGSNPFLPAIRYNMVENVVRILAIGLLILTFMIIFNTIKENK